MAIETKIGGEGTLFATEDKRIRFGPLTLPAGWNATLQGAYVPRDLTGAEVRFVVRKTDLSDVAIIDRAIDGLLGTYTTDVGTNTQQPYIDLTDDENSLANFPRLKDDAPYRWSLKVMEPDSETVLGYGDFGPQYSTGR